MTGFLLVMTLTSAMGWHFSVSESARAGENEAVTDYEAIVLGEKTRITGNMGDFIIDIPGNRIFMTDPERKVYTEVDLKAWSKAAEKMKSAMAADTSAEVKVLRTSEKKEILGKDAVKYNVLVNGSLEEEIWVREDLKAEEFLTFEKSVGKIFGKSFIREKIEKELRRLTSGLPVLTRSISKGGEIYTSEIKKAERINIEQKELLPPAGFKKVSPEAFFRMRGE
ncbi:MAG: DUF4412 domain-containing protein [Candidatus Hydrothermae bacterium]|nr:DUF4412 domain-containing protein [Candidatus Hydrothermae bacterium]